MFFIFRRRQSHKVISFRHRWIFLYPDTLKWGSSSKSLVTGGYILFSTCIKLPSTKTSLVVVYSTGKEEHLFSPLGTVDAGVPRTHVSQILVGDQLFSAPDRRHSWQSKCISSLLPCVDRIFSRYTHLLPIPLPDGSHVCLSIYLSVRLWAVTWNIHWWTQLVSDLYC